VVLVECDWIVFKLAEDIRIAFPSSVSERSRRKPLKLNVLRLQPNAIAIPPCCRKTRFVWTVTRMNCNQHHPACRQHHLSDDRPRCSRMHRRRIANAVHPTLPNESAHRWPHPSTSFSPTPAITKPSAIKRFQKYENVLARDVRLSSSAISDEIATETTHI